MREQRVVRNVMNLPQRNVPRRPPTVDAIVGRSLTETAVVAIGTTLLVVGVTILALAAAGAAGDDAFASTLTALIVGLATIAISLGGARVVDRRLGDRRDCSTRPMEADRAP